jgi:hypothetical protein
MIKVPVNKYMLSSGLIHVTLYQRPQAEKKSLTFWKLREFVLCPIEFLEGRIGMETYRVNILLCALQIWMFIETQLK